MSEKDHIGLYINIASMQIRRNLDAIFSQYDGLTGIQGRLLGELDHAETLRQDFFQKDILRLYGARRSSINSVISTMEQNGYLIRVPDLKDARLKRLVLTDRGRRTARAIKQSLDDYEDSLAAHYTAEEARLLISLLRRLIPECTGPHEDPGRKEPERSKNVTNVTIERM